MNEIRINRRRVIAGGVALAAGAGAHPVRAATEAVHRHAIAMHGEPALPEGFSGFPYANAAAPKGGLFRMAVFGSFDTLNSMSVRGNAPAVLVPYIVQPLMMRSLDEPFTLYGVLAESVAVPADRGFVEFRIHPQARFADGKPVGAKDVVFTWELFSTKGRPNYRANARKIARVEALDARTVRFTFKATNDRELPLILGLMPVLPAHATDPETFDRPGFTPFLGSGPYALETVDPGSSILLRRRADYWGVDLPAHRGLYNFDALRLDYFRDSNTMFEAFKTGLIDFRIETDPTKWRTGYDVAAVREKRIIRETYPLAVPKGMSGFIMNSRRAPFDDIRVREAMLHFFDFEWLNAKLHQGVYTRTGSFFADSELSSVGHSASPREEALAEGALAAMRADFRAGTWRPPITDGSGRDRAVMRRGVDLLRDAGYRVRDGVMARADGTTLSFEILVTTRDKERLALAFADTLRQVGIVPVIRLVDSSQYWSRLKDKLFDVVIESYVVGASPGQEQANRWSRAAADAPGTLNWAGVKSPAVDRAIGAMLAATSREDFVASVRLLDRLLLSGFHVLPLYHLSERWLARWAHIGRPARWPTYDLSIDLFWSAANR